MLDRRTLGKSLLGFAAASVAGSASAQTALDVQAVVTAAATNVRDRYVDPVVATTLANQMLARLAAGAYATQSRTELASRVTADLRAWTHDIHMSMSYAPPTPALAEDPTTITEDDEHTRNVGWGVQTVARLPGNIGLWRITHFPSPPHWVAPKYAASMELLTDTAALIIDLTVNHGGGEDTTAFLMSYFLDGEVEIGRAQARGEPVEIMRTTDRAPGPRYGMVRPIYITISNHTFSGGEAIAYFLKTRRNAVLVGERTRGGAHMGDTFPLSDHFQIFIVTGRGQGRDWEGRGVPPDVQAPAASAVAVAHGLALDQLLAAGADPQHAQVLRNVAAHSIENLSSFDFSHH